MRHHSAGKGPYRVFTCLCAPWHHIAAPAGPPIVNAMSCALRRYHPCQPYRRAEIEEKRAQRVRVIGAEYERQPTAGAMTAMVRENISRHPTMEMRKDTPALLGEAGATHHGMRYPAWLSGQVERTRVGPAKLAQRRRRSRFDDCDCVWDILGICRVHTCAGYIHVREYLKVWCNVIISIQVVFKTHAICVVADRGDPTKASKKPTKVSQ